MVVGAVGIGLLLFPAIRLSPDATEGAVWLAGGERIEVAAALLRVALVQRAIPVQPRPAPGQVVDVVDRLVRETRSLGVVDLVVWSETALNAIWPENRPIVVRRIESRVMIQKAYCFQIVVKTLAGEVHVLERPST